MAGKRARGARKRTQGRTVESPRKWPEWLERARPLWVRLWWVLAAAIALWSARQTYHVGMARGFWQDDYGLVPQRLEMTWWQPWVTTYASHAGYRPIGSFVVWIMSHVFGLTLVPWKLTGAILQGANVFLLMVLLRRFQWGVIALAVGACWCRMPVHLEARIWSADLPALLGMLFFLLALVAYERNRLWAAAVLCVCAMATKELYVFVGVGLWAIDVLRGRPVRWRFVGAVVVYSLAWIVLDAWLSRHGWIMDARNGPNGGGVIQTMLRYWVLVTTGANPWARTMDPRMLLQSPPFYAALALAGASMTTRNLRALLVLAACGVAVTFSYYAPRYTYASTAMVLWWLAALVEAGLAYAAGRAGVRIPSAPVQAEAAPVPARSGAGRESRQQIYGP